MTIPYVLESPVNMTEGESWAYNLTLPGSPTITGTPTAKMYNNETDTSATNLSGAASASGSVITTPILQALKGGEDYTLAVTAVVNGRTEVHKCVINVGHPYE